MAEPKVVCACVLFLTLIFFSCGVLLCEGRVLKTEKNNNTLSHGDNSQRKVVENHYFKFGHDDHNMHGNVNVSDDEGPGHSPDSPILTPISISIGFV
ncbi:hypothetical protein K7X08_014587 [Anisodus acutangulus]|uniref:Transmembrane protein n=1 Tax=Anisodus acutangulus TaxID=402998 RepID=A0A9Q1R3A0_9SOLA|nr:hypothetical protein K7X08_014587 [Anisodus acutangulus]